jgi:hypothetical protein
MRRGRHDLGPQDVEPGPVAVAGPVGGDADERGRGAAHAPPCTRRGG